jgi:hypothetical protein
LSDGSIKHEKPLNHPYGRLRRRGPNDMVTPQPPIWGAKSYGAMVSEEAKVPHLGVLIAFGIGVVKAMGI